MPLTSKGRKVMSAMAQQYGAEKGKQVFYASKNKGTISGVEGKKKSVAMKMGKPNKHGTGNYISSLRK